MVITEIQLDPSTNCRLILKLYKNVKNLDELHKKVISGQLQCCIMKANLILHPLQVTIAANKAAVSQHQGTLISKTVYTELLFNLSITKNLTKSLSLFGMDNKQTSIIVAVICKNDENYEDYKDIFQEIQGDETSMDELKEIADKTLIRKTYSVNDVDENSVLNNIINKIVTKGF